MDRTLDIKHTKVEEAEYYVLVPFSSTMITVNVLRSNIEIKLFTDKLLWPLNHFYMNHSITVNGIQLTFDPDLRTMLQMKIRTVFAFTSNN